MTRDRDNVPLHEPGVRKDPIIERIIRNVVPKTGMIPHFIIPAYEIRVNPQVSHETVSVQIVDGTHGVTWNAGDVGAVPYLQSCLVHDFIEHLPRWWLGVIDMTVGTIVSPCSDVHVNGAGDLTFCFAEDGSSVFVLEMGAVIHAWRDAAPGARLDVGVFCSRRYFCWRSCESGFLSGGRANEVQDLTMYAALEVSIPGMRHQLL